MAIISDLSGLGMSPQLAGKVGHQITLAVQGTGTAQIGAKAIGTSVTEAIPIAGQTAYVLPTGAVSMAKEFWFYNGAATAVTALIYPPTGGATLNGSTSAALSVPQGKGAMLMLIAGSGGAAPKWFGLLSA